MTERLEPDYNRGLYGKYYVERLNDPSGKHDDCRYFTLDPQHDKIARHALAHYAVLARGAGLVDLADDINDWLTTLEQENYVQN
jgi:hypothetical protein